MEGNNLKGRTAVVLGGSSPYGAATARMLAREGAGLVLGGRSRDRLEALEQEIRASGGQAVVVGTHLAKRHHSAHLMEAAVEAFGGLDVLVYMARASAPPLETLEVEAWERSVDVNLKGFLYTVAAALPIMRSGGGGHIICFAAENPEAPDPVHRASHAAVRVILQELARELSSEGIRTSAVRLDDARRADPGRCAGAVRRVLLDPPDAATGFSDARVVGTC
jgi:NADP-dependent 3-hydroxy acid dehydrogenase YdfG